MKTRILIVSSLIVLSGILSANPASTPDAHYRRGMAAEQAGDPTAAREAYELALKLNPQHANARYRLGQLKINRGVVAAKGREAKIGAVMLPEIHLEGASVKESLDALAIMIEKQSEGEVTPNFIIQDPEAKLAEAKISFQLKNVPVSAVLNYILTQSRAKVKYDEYAVVVSPK
jgi:tetratricopeptide (TPR) repeat protein